MPTLVRQFATDAPAIRIWTANDASIQQLILLDAAANGYHVDYYNWDREDNAPSTRTMSGKVYPHPLGFRMRAVISLNIWKPSYAPDSGKRPRNYGFTELDLEALDNALAAGQSIEFYLHGHAVGAALDQYRKCEHRVTNSGRGDGNWIHGLTIEFSGLTLRSTRLAEL